MEYRTEYDDMFSLLESFQNREWRISKRKNFPFFLFLFVEENTRIMYEQTKSMLNAYDDAMTHAKCEAGIW